MNVIVTIVTALLLGFGLTPSASAAEESRGSLAVRHDLKVVAFGDSIAYGIGTTSPRQQAWPVLLGARREAVRSSRLVSPGVDGIAAVDRYRRDVLSHNPDVAIVAYGMNDLTFSSPRKIVAGIKRIQRWNNQRGVATLVTTVTPVGEDRIELNSERRKVNALIRKTFGTRVIDFDRALLDRGQRALPHRFDCGDAIHPNALGYRKMATLAGRHLANLSVKQQR